MSDPGGQHVPVLLKEVGELLEVQPGNRVLDCTVGLGGHAEVLAKAAGKTGLLIGLDVDESNLRRASLRLDGCGCPYRLFRCNFKDFQEALEESQTPKVDVVFADLGVSSTQIEDAERGLSFQSDGPLDMRLDDRLEQTAADLVNRLSESDLADLIYQNAQERSSRRIARAIHRSRKLGRITTTAQLADVVCRALRVNPQSRASKIHPATRTFQALRIAVNDELGALDVLLEHAPGALAPGGRIGVISFHSLEDSMVKRDFNRRKTEGIYRILTKKPVSPSQQERTANPRSRSAKLRVSVRTE